MPHTQILQKTLALLTLLILLLTIIHTTIAHTTPPKNIPPQPKGITFTVLTMQSDIYFMPAFSINFNLLGIPIEPKKGLRIFLETDIVLGWKYIKIQNGTIQDEAYFPATGNITTYSSYGRNLYTTPIYGSENIYKKTFGLDINNHEEFHYCVGLLSFRGIQFYHPASQTYYILGKAEKTSLSETYPIQ